MEETLPSVEGKVVSMENGSDPRSLATAYLTSWKARDFDTLSRILAPDVSFRCVLGGTDDVEHTLAGGRGMPKISRDFDVQQMVVEGVDVMTWYASHTPVSEPM